MALVGVQPESAAELKRAQKFAEAWNVPVLAALDSIPATNVTPVADESLGVKVIVQANALALAFLDKKRGKPYIVDFQSPTWRSRFQQPISKQHIFRRALGINGDRQVHVFDATAGFGQDSLMALSMGCKVTAAERSPVVFALLQNGIERAREEEVLKAAFQRLSLKCGESSEILKSMTGAQAPDVVFIDPMFDKPKKSAKSPKEMQLLQELVPAGSSMEEEQLLNLALSVARSRVVVKRPLKTRALKGTSHSFKGQSIRYDVYLAKS